MEKTVIFETHDRYPKKVFDKNDKLILDFNRQNLNLVKTADGALTRVGKTDSWICVLTDVDMIKAAKGHKGFEKSFWIVNHIPKKKEYGSIAKAGPQTSTDSMAHLIKQMKEKALRFGELKAKCVKADGSYYASATKDQIEEYENLKSELNEE